MNYKLNIMLKVLKATRKSNGVVLKPLLGTFSPGEVGLWTKSVLRSPLVLNWRFDQHIGADKDTHGRDGVNV